MDAGGRWWREDPHYGWLSEYLHARGLAKPVRRLMALVSASLTFVGFSALVAPSTHPGVSAWIGALASVAGISFAVMWLRSWPSRAQSLALGVVGGAFIAAGAVLQTDPMIGLMGCTGLAVVGGYIAFFQTTRAVICHVVVAICAGAYCAVQVALHGQSFVAVAGFWLVVELNLAVPFAILITIRTLGADVLRSDRDALTGVLNRRALYERAGALLTAGSVKGGVNLLVVMIDLDNFKRLNDTYGHSAGDQALAAVGWVLRENSSSTAIMGRVGGEEFLVVDTLPQSECVAVPKRLCAAIAATPHPVTASVGATVLSLEHLADRPPTFDELAALADNAMYQAKRDGGNQVWHHSG